jgi:DegV family protein with EDD domain
MQNFRAACNHMGIFIAFIIKREKIAEKERPIMYKIISDGGCDFSPQEAEKLGVTVVPFYICIGDEAHKKEGIDITQEEYFSRLESEKDFFPKTAQPSPQDYIDVYTPILEAGCDILQVTISAKLSGSHNSAIIAASMLCEEYPKRLIEIIDSENASVGQGLILTEIAKMQAAGLELEETIELAQRVLKSTRVYFTVDNLVYLKKGGRIGPTTAFVGGILGLRPILQLADGAVTQLDNVRGKRNAMKLIGEAMVHALKDDVEHVNLRIGHVLSLEDAEEFKENTEKALGIEIATPVTNIGAAIGTHAGPGALGFAYCRKYETLERTDA